MFTADHKISREQISFVIRVVLLVLVCLAATAVLVARTTYLTAIKGERLRELADNTYLSQELIPAPRGTILDRYGRPLASNEVRFDVLATLHRSDAEVIEASLAEVRRYLPEQVTARTIEDVSRIQEGDRDGKRLASQIRMSEALPLLERQPFLPGIIIEQTFRRVYPYGRATSHWTGYVGPIFQRELQEYLDQGYSRTDLVGKMGLEARLEHDLSGQKGHQRTLRDMWSRLQKAWVDEGDEAMPGHSITLTMDVDLQIAATQALTGREGAIVVVDPRNGDVLAMASSPDYDANQPGRAYADGNSAYNKAVREHFPPGSTFKLVTAAAALMAGHDPTRRIFCDGRLEVTPEFRPACDSLSYGGHGSLDLREAITVSCNIYFYQLARDLRDGGMFTTSAAFGFGQRTGIELVGKPQWETTGVLREPGRLDLADRILMGIGQGRLISVTPLQLTMAYAALANGGSLYAPRVVLAMHNALGQRLDASQPPLPVDEIEWTEEQRQILMDGFRGVVENTRRGTGRHAGFDPGMRVAGKTGSAQYTAAEDALTHAWFVCFSPWDNPEVCVTVLIEKSGHGGEIAAPIAKVILERYYALKASREHQPPAGGEGDRRLTESGAPGAVAGASGAAPEGDTGGSGQNL